MAMRVVSVLPSATEIVFTLGHGNDLVARSEECDYPPPVRALPAVMRPRTRDFDRPSASIDARVQSVRGNNESLYELDIPLLRELRPDLLLTQDLCGVCSITEAEVSAACSVAGVAPRVVSLSPQRLDEVATSIETVAEALDDPAAGRDLAGRFRDRVRPQLPRVPSGRVAVVEWLDPPILAGLWAPDQVRAAGGEVVGATPGAPGQRTDWTGVERLDPELLILSPCSFTVERTRREIETTPGVRRAIARIRPRWGTYLVDEAYFSRPGPRLADGVELIDRILQGRDPKGPMPVERWDPSGPGGGP